MTLVKMVGQTLFRIIVIGRGTAEMGFCSSGERLGSTVTTSRKHGD